MKMSLVWHKSILCQSADGERHELHLLGYVWIMDRWVLDKCWYNSFLDNLDQEELATKRLHAALERALAKDPHATQLR